MQGEYLIKNILGEGELGVTYEAENARLKRKFAVLMLKRELRPTQGMMLQVRDDLRRAEPLQSVGIMPVKMIVDHMMIPGFATELLEGETLRARCSRGPLPPPRALAIVLAVARALDALHKAGAVHGDLRPENIFLVRPGAKSSFAGRVMVVEHSLHPLRRRAQGLDDQLPLYKLMYRPPECLAGERGPHIGGDVFVLGAILHECLTGRPAFYDEVADFVIDNLNQPPKPIPANPATGLTQPLAATLSVLVASACARDPELRPPDMGEFIVAIEQIAQGAGFTLPTVITEEPQAVPAAPATPTASRMNRLLHRLSGVFPQVPLPPMTDPVGSSPPAASGRSLPRVAGPSGATTPAGAAVPASVAIRPQATTMPPIVAPRAKVTLLLQKLSGVFPVLQVSPEGNLETLSSSDPKIAGAAQANQLAQAAASKPPISAPPAEVTQPAGAVPPPAALATAGAPPAALATAGALPAALATASALFAAAGDDPRPAGTATGDPSGPPAGPQPTQPTQLTEPAPGHPTLLINQPPSGPTADHAAAAAPSASSNLATDVISGPSPGIASAEAAAVRAEAPATNSAPAGVAASAAAGPAAAVENSVPVKGSEVSKALALLRLQQQARATGQPVDAQRVGAGPATPESVVPTFMAAGPAAAPTASQGPPATVGSAAPSSASQRPTVPPVAAEPSAAHSATAVVAAASAAAAQDAQAAEEQAAWLGLAFDAVTPAVSGTPSTFTPTYERPRAGPPSAADIALDSTLEPDDLADFIAAAAHSAGSRGPKTLSEIPTRPAALAGLDPISRYNEAKTQPAIRSLPFTEQATQAKLNPELFSLATAVKGAVPELPALAPATAPASGAAITAPVTLAATPAAPAAVAPSSVPATQQLDSLRELEGVSLLMEVAPPPPPDNKPTPARPPRVSQLIKALQQGQIDQAQAMQQASGTAAREPAAPASGPAGLPTPSTPAASGGQPIAPAASGPSGPTPQGRVSPGLMALAPPPTGPADSPWGTSTQMVVPAPGPRALAQVGLRGFLLRNQEVMAALLGALLVLLGGIAYLLLR